MAALASSGCNVLKMISAQAKSVILSVTVLTSLLSATLASKEGLSHAIEVLPAEGARAADSAAGWPASAPEAIRPGYWPSGHTVSDSVSTNNSTSRISGMPSVSPPSNRSGPLQTPHEAVTNDSRGSGPVCSNGERIILCFPSVEVPGTVGICGVAVLWILACFCIFLAFRPATCLRLRTEAGSSFWRSGSFD